MHVLILNHHSLHSEFIQKAFRYENIGADICHPDNLIKIWYGQYDALIIPIKSWLHPPFNEILEKRSFLGEVPTIITAKTIPPLAIQKQINQNTQLQFIENNQPFHQIIKDIKLIIADNKQTTNHQTVKLGELKIDFQSREVKRRNQSIHLKNKEFALLEFLAKHAGIVLTRTCILENVWDRNVSILSNTVDVHISRLRKKLDRDFKHKIIITIPCVGYKLLN